MNPKIYSYSRISSDKQARGTGIAQQKDVDVLNRLSYKYNLPISNEVFSDIGKSAFKGDHLDAEFGRVLSMIEDGRISKGSILAITSLDRLSRQDVNVALELFLSVINKGVAIYTSIDDKLYSPDDENLSASLIVSIIYLERANNESKTKAARTRGNAMAIYKSVLEGARGSRDADAHCKAIESVGNNGWWVDTSTGFVKPHPVYFPILRDLVDLTLKMYSQRQIKAHLEANYADSVPEIMTSPKDGKREWSAYFIGSFHNLKSLLGEKVINLGEEQLVIPDYYSPVCTPDELAQMQAIRRKKSTRGTKKPDSPTGLLNGLNVLKCSKCGGGMSYVHKQTKVKRGNGRSARYECSNGVNGRKGCSQWGFAGNQLDEYILKKARVKAFNTMVPKATAQLLELGQQRLDIQAQLDESTAEYQAIRNAGKKAPRVLLFEISDIEEKLEQIDDQISAIRLKGAGSALNKTWKELFSEYLEADMLDSSQIELRLRVKQILKQMITKIDSQRTGKKVWRTFETIHRIEWEDGEIEEFIMN
ncbi:recombinase family protein [Vibrio alfacsensis]|uniref:recombinase family protein n=1 Tax=Vibrio alfacsensis TaxID=1074311 RepID=UPI00406765A7